MTLFEIEIKSLLGTKDQADLLIEKLKNTDPDLQILGSHSQLNHYFTGGDLKLLYDNLSAHIDNEKKANFQELVSKAKDYSVRTRLADDKVIFVMKLSVDDTTSSNGTARLEFESTVNLSLDELDAILLKSGFTYQAKWSRDRQEFTYKGKTVTIDKNAGYGYLAEFEAVIDDVSKTEETKHNLRSIMSELGVAELNQDRLARMFDYYNHNWQDYYGTDKVFTIE